MTPTTTQVRTKDPKTFRAISINDPHYAASSPPAFKAPYLDHLRSNLTQVFNKAVEFNVDALLWGGDIFHLKEPRNNPLWLISQVISDFAGISSGGRLLNLGIGGNHDYKFGSLETGLYGSPLDVLLASGQYTLLDNHEFVFSGDGTSVRVAGGSYLHSQAQHVRDKKRQGADHLITLGHFWLGTQTGEFFGEALYGFDFFAESESDIIIVGHHHEDKGIVEVNGRHFVSQGSISITGAHPHDLTRRPAAVLIEITGPKIEFTVLRPKMEKIEDLLDLQKHEEVKKESREVAEFVASLSSLEITAADPEAVLKEIAPSEEIRSRAHGYIEQAEAK